MRKTRFLLACVLALSGAAAVSSCSQDSEAIPAEVDVEGQAQRKNLELNLDIWQGEEGLVQGTRAIKSGTYFSNGDKIGFFVTNSGSTALYNSSSGNLWASKTSSSWTMGSSVPLSAATARVHAYYPYSSSVSMGISGMKSVVCVTGTEDYLYGTSSSTVNASSSTANITMKHLLSQIRFSFTNSNSPNNCVLTNITIQDAGSTVTCYKSGTYDITTGTITNGTSGGTSEAVSNGNFKTSPFVFNLLMFPMTIAASTVKAVFTIDGGSYTMNIPPITWEAGKIYTYPVQMVGNNLVLNPSGITITDWVVGSTASATTFN